MEKNGAILATRSTLARGDRPISRTGAASETTVVRRAVTPTHRVRFGGNWVADTEDVILLFEPGRYPVAYFMESEVTPGALEVSGHTTQHPDLGPTAWYTVHAGDKSAPRGAWQHTALPVQAHELQGRVAFAWRAMDAFFEEDERITGHAADSYHRIDIRQSSRHLVVSHRDRRVADTRRPLALYESGFAPRWYVPRADIDETALSPVDHQTFCPYKGMCSYYDIGEARVAAWSYREAYAEVGRIKRLCFVRAGCRLGTARRPATSSCGRSDSDTARPGSRSRRSWRDGKAALRKSPWHGCCR